MSGAPMNPNKNNFLVYIALGLIVGICIFPCAFWVGWRLSNNLFVTDDGLSTQSSPVNLTPEIKLATEKVTEEEGDIYGELIMICTGSGNAIFVQLDGKYFDAPNYCGMWSPDGRYVIMSDLDVVAGPDVLFRQRGSDEIVNITRDLQLPQWISFFSWSPNGKYVSIAGWDQWDENIKDGIYLINMSSGFPPRESKLLFETDETYGLGNLVWAPNGRYIGITGGTNTNNPYVISLDGKIVWEPPSEIYPLGGDMISWSSDSTRFVYTAFTDNTTTENFDTQLVIGDVSKGTAHSIDLPMKAFFPYWSADGEWIIFLTIDEIGGGSYLYAIDPDGNKTIKLGDANRAWTIGQGSPDKNKFLLAEDIFSLNIDQNKPDPYANSIRYYIVDLSDFRKVLFFQNSDFSSMPLSVYPLQWLPNIGE